MQYLSPEHEQLVAEFIVK